jgi:phosphatidylinositol alpha-mannosyltransferase
VVATNIPGYASVLTNEQEGLLVEPRNHQALALAIVRLLADESLQQRLSAQGRLTAANYAWPKVAARVLDTYERAAADAAHASWRRR